MGKAKADNQGMSVREYAAHRKSTGLPGYSSSAVQRAISRGTIKRTIGKGRSARIDPAIADKAWEENTKTPANASAKAPGADPVSSAPSYAQARAVREAYQARIARLKYEEMEGTLVNVDVVRVEAYKEGRRVRDKMTSIPARLAGVIAGMSNARKIEILLEDEISRALGELTNG